MESLLIDLRHAVRRLRKSPAGTAVSLTRLALGTGANLAVFSLVNTLYFKPLPVPDPGRLVHVLSQRAGGSGNMGFSSSDYASVREHTDAVPSLAAERSVAQLHLVSRRGVRELGGAFVSAEYFPLVGITAARGRVTQTSATPGGDRDSGIVISDSLVAVLFRGRP